MRFVILRQDDKELAIDARDIEAIVAVDGGSKITLRTPSTATWVTLPEPCTMTVQNSVASIVKQINAIEWDYLKHG